MKTQGENQQTTKILKLGANLKIFLRLERILKKIIYKFVNMKKVILLVAILLAYGCDKEDDKCNCPKAKMTTFAYGTGYFYINNLPINCATGRPDEEWLLERNYIFVSCE